MTGCFKDSIHNSADTTAYFAITEGGPLNLANASLELTTPDSVTVYPNPGITSPYLLNTDVRIKIGVDDAARVAYNQANGTNFEALPDSLYTFADTTFKDTSSGLLSAGSRSISLPIKIYSGKADLRKSYMLAVSIKDVQGHLISSDLGTIYFNNVGSAVAGRYKVTGTRTNYIGPVSAGVIGEVIDLSTLPVQTTTTQSANVVLLNYSDLGIAGWQYIITYDPDLQNVTIQPNDVMQNSETGFFLGTFKVDIQDYNATTRTLHFKTEYEDLAGNARVVDEYLTAQ